MVQGIQSVHAIRINMEPHKYRAWVVQRVGSWAAASVSCASELIEHSGHWLAGSPGGDGDYSTLAHLVNYVALTHSLDTHPPTYLPSWPFSATKGGIEAAIEMNFSDVSCHRLWFGSTSQIRFLLCRLDGRPKVSCFAFLRNSPFVQSTATERAKVSRGSR